MYCYSPKVILGSMKFIISLFYFMFISQSSPGLNSYQYFWDALRLMAYLSLVFLALVSSRLLLLVLYITLHCSIKAIKAPRVIIQIILPGHWLPLLHFLAWYRSPGQGRPPFCAGGSSQTLTLFCSPPHSASQSDQEVHSLQPLSTGIRWS